MLPDQPGAVGFLASHGESGSCLHTLPAPRLLQPLTHFLAVARTLTKHLVQDLMQLFAPFGSIQDCRLLHSGDGSRGVGALVRMGSLEEATRAIEALNNRVPTGG